MEHAIEMLKLAVANAEAAEVKHRRTAKDYRNSFERYERYADEEATAAAGHRQALRILEAASTGPIWPKPKGDTNQEQR